VWSHGPEAGTGGFKPAPTLGRKLPSGHCENKSIRIAVKDEHSEKTKD
jgi:hypothetical protein